MRGVRLATLCSAATWLLLAGSAGADAGALFSCLSSEEDGPTDCGVELALLHSSTADLEQNEVCKYLLREKLSVRAEDVEPQTAYFTLFEQYISKSRPFQTTCEGCSAYTEDGLAPDSQLPIVLTNNYLRRTSLPKQGLSPRLVTIDETEKVLHCSNAMNMVLWPAHADSEPLVVSLRDWRAQEYFRTFDSPSSLGSFERVVDAGSSAVKSPCASVGPKPRVFQLTLKPNKALIVPHSMAATISASKPTSLLMSCMVDASNLHAVVSDLAKAGSNLSEELTAVAADLRSAVLDRSMARVPAPLKLGSYLRDESSAGLPEVTEAAEADEVGATKADDKRRSRRKRRGGEYKSWQDVVSWEALVTASTVPRVWGLKADAWARFTATLVVGEASSMWATMHGKATKVGLRVRSCIVDNDSLLHDQFLVTKSGAITAISDAWLAERCSLQEFAVDPGVLAAGPLKLVAGPLLPDTRYQFQVQRFLDEATSPFSSWTVRGRTRALAAPVARAKQPVQVSNRRALAVEIRMEEGTVQPPRQVLLAAAAVRLAPPADDGGLPVTRCEVFTRFSSDGSGEWSLTYVNSTAVECEQGLLCCEARNLQPRLAFELTARVCNRLGCSEFYPHTALSANEAPRTPECAGREYLLAGLDEEDSLEAVLARSSVTVADFPLAVDMVAQQVVAPRRQRSSAAQKFDAWRSHWGPQCGVVVGKPVFVTGQITGEARLANQIAFVRRDGTPLYALALGAQRAGAVAVVLVDDGRCSRFDQRCLPGATKSGGDGFAQEDVPALWEPLKIATAFMKAADAEALRHIFLDAVGSHDEL